MKVYTLRQTTERVVALVKVFVSDFVFRFWKPISTVDTVGQLALEEIDTRSNGDLQWPKLV